MSRISRAAIASGAALLAAVSACDPGVSPVSAGTATGALITIRNFQYLPPTLTVAAGATVQVRNEDGVRHTLTSEAASGALTPGAIPGLEPFDTGDIRAATTLAFVVPPSAAPGTVIPYYCREHTAIPEEGVLLIAAP